MLHLVLHELWDFVSLFQNSSLSTFYQVMCVYVRKFKVTPFHDCITIVLGKELLMGRHPCPTDTFLGIADSDVGLRHGTRRRL